MKQMIIILVSMFLILVGCTGGKFYMDKQAEKEKILQAIAKDKEQIEEIVRWNFKDVKSVTFEWVRTEKDGSVPVKLDKSLTTTPVGGVLRMRFYLNDDKSQLYGIGINMKKMDELHEGGSFIGVTGTIEKMIGSLKIGGGYADFLLKNKEKYTESPEYEYVKSCMGERAISEDKIIKRLKENNDIQDYVDIYTFMLRSKDIKRLKERGYTSDITDEEILNYWEDYYNE